MTAHAAEEPGRREPAPGDLRLVQAFLNTNDIEAGVDELRNPAALRDWLAANGLLDAGTVLSEADLRLALQVREALRGLVLAHHEGSADPRDVRTLNRAAEDARLRVRFEADGGTALSPGRPGVDGAIARLLAIVHLASIEGTWSRVKACRSDACRWVYYDRSRNRSSAWCSMAECGNREKARAYRRRRSGAAS